MRDEMSVARTRPSGPTRRAADSVWSPAPAPRRGHGPTAFDSREIEHDLGGRAEPAPSVGPHRCHASAASCHCLRVVPCRRPDRSLACRASCDGWRNGLRNGRSVGFVGKFARDVGGGCWSVGGRAGAARGGSWARPERGHGRVVLAPASRHRQEPSGRGDLPAGRARGRRAVWGHAWEAGSAPPFWPLDPGPARARARRRPCCASPGPRRRRPPRGLTQPSCATRRRGGPPVRW
jgi:hypothetical protein